MGLGKALKGRSVTSNAVDGGLSFRFLFVA